MGPIHSVWGDVLMQSVGSHKQDRNDLQCCLAAAHSQLGLLCLLHINGLSDQIIHHVLAEYTTRDKINLMKSQIWYFGFF